MRASVDENICQGHTQCAMIAPSLFQLREDDGHAYVAEPEIPSELEALALEAQDACPERAIRITR